MNTLSFTLLALATLIVGCSRESSSPMQPAMKVLTASPADGATNVRLDAVVTLDFGAAMNTDAVERGLHLLAEPDMFSGCPDPTMGSHGTMDSAMDDANMLRHMVEQHGSTGRYSWNESGTACTFKPDSLMRPQTRYMVHMSGEMLNMMSQAGVGMMRGRMNSAGEMMLHFQTTTLDDHGGHH